MAVKISNVWKYYLDNVSILDGILYSEKIKLVFLSHSLIFKPDILCYVCSKAPISLEVNTQHVKAKLGVNSPLIMHGSTLLFDSDDDSFQIAYLS